MTARRFHRATEVIPRRPWKSTSPFASGPIEISKNTKTQRVHARYDAVFPSFISIVRSPGRPVILVSDSWARKKKKNNKQKIHGHFSDGLCGTIVPGTNPHLSQGQMGQNGNSTVELNRKRLVCPRESGRDGSRLSQGWFLFVPDTVPPNVYVYWFLLARIQMGMNRIARFERLVFSDRGMQETRV